MFQKKESSDLRESCFWQVCASATKVCGELNLRRKKLIPNIVIPFANSNFIRKTLYNTKKVRFWPVCCFKSYSEIFPKQ